MAAGNREGAGRLPVLQDEVEASAPLVFISCAREDKKKALDLYGVLRDKGLRTWIDEKDLLGGEDWERTITATLKRADFIVICFSSTVVTKKGFVQREIRIALEAAKEIPPDAVLTIPVRFDECTISTEVAKLHCVDVFQPDGVERLIRAIVVHWGRSKKRLHLPGST